MHISIYIRVVLILLRWLYRSTLECRALLRHEPHPLIYGAQKCFFSVTILAIVLSLLFNMFLVLVAATYMLSAMFFYVRRTLATTLVRKGFVSLTILAIGCISLLKASFSFTRLVIILSLLFNMAMLLVGFSYVLCAVFQYVRRTLQRQDQKKHQ